MKSLKSKINLLLLLSLSIGSTNLKAEDAIFIEKNQPAPYSGILFTESKARELRNDLLESTKYQIKFESELSKGQSLLSVIKLKETEIELYRAQNQRLIKQGETSDTMKYVWFGLGILVTGAAVYGARGLAK